MPVSKFAEDVNVEFVASRHNWFRGVSLWARGRREGDRQYISFPEPVVWTEIDRNSVDYVERDPFLVLTDHEAQILMDELWKFGIRPSDGSGNVGQIKAMDDHLKDMRHLVFKGNLPK